MFRLFLLVLLLQFGWLTEAGELSATGGGIVKPGETARLSYIVEEAWSQCFWFWYDLKICLMKCG